MPSDKASSLVVIGGWLGCNPRHLKPYERFYNSLGFDALSFVASPLCVVDSTLNPQDLSHVPSSKQWHSSTNTGVDVVSMNSDTEMQALAWKVLGDIHNSQAEVFIYHSFSNGGCFLWESICKILLLKDCKNCDRKTSAVLKRLHGSCKGVVFDSCPAWFGSKKQPSLWQALQYCSKEQRRRVHSVHGDRIHTVDKAMLDRNLNYFQNLAACPLDIPQLYLYSKDDNLARQEYISKMVDTRRSRQKNSVSKKVWEKSSHCRHLLEHSDDYKTAVKVFIQQLNVLVQSRL